MPTAPTPIPDLPVPIPITSDPTDFDGRADDTWTALPGVITGVGDAAQVTYDNAVEATTAAAAASGIAAAAAMATDHVATSTSSASLTVGSKTFTIAAGKGFLPTEAIVVARLSAPEQRAYASVTSYSGTALVVNFPDTDHIVGTGGPFTDWIIISQIWATPGATVADILAGTATTVPMTPGAEYAALAEVTLSISSGHVTPNFNTMRNAVVTLTGNITLDNPSAGMVVGKDGVIRCVQDATGSRLFSAKGSYWKRPGGLPTFSTAPGATDLLIYRVMTPTFILFDLAKNPT
jgi:hypothetical protein